jgi:hypothetical protein
MRSYNTYQGGGDLFLPAYVGAPGKCTDTGFCRFEIASYAASTVNVFSIK